MNDLMPISLVAGLGNPGSNYAESRHNIGFMVLDHLIKRFSLIWKRGFQGEYCTLDVPTLSNQSIEAVGEASPLSPPKANPKFRKVFFLKPFTFMNLSGNSVQELSYYYKIPPESIMAVHDDLDFPFGRVKLKFGGSSAGHNGIRSISASLGEDYYRLRIGVGGVNRALLKGYTAEYVLAPFTQKEKKQLNEYILFISETVEEVLHNDITVAMQIINQHNAPFPIAE
ncbi:MAG: aminoacyl-tRNA hydrolase [Deferribacteraceae bacterium]|jgi:PTH1 family peptidyl-tRNA hydrolase|nr:aminoacyl-tRNA hydrolase [Deferribacteraceae bacterium]